jgi:hypothetical protein
MRAEPATLKMVALSDAQRSFPAVEDQRDDKVLLVAEVAVEPPQKLVAVLRVSVTGAPDEIEIGRCGAEEGIC